MQGYNFTERVRLILAMAREEARERQHEYVGTEHILLGLIREGEGIAMAVLQNLGVDTDHVVVTIDEIVRKGKSVHPGVLDLPYTSRAKSVLELAMATARELKHSYIGSEHLLLGLVREAKGIAAQVLEEQGLTLDRATAETLRLLGTSPDDVKQATGTTAGEGAPPRFISVEVEWVNGNRFTKRFLSARTAIEFLRGLPGAEPRGSE